MTEESFLLQHHPDRLGLQPAGQDWQTYEAILGVPTSTNVRLVTVEGKNETEAYRQAEVLCEGDEFVRGVTPR